MGIGITIPQPTQAYIISEEGTPAEILDSIVAEEEYQDTLVPTAANIFWLHQHDLSFYYRQHTTDILRLLPGTYTGRFGTYGNRENVRLFSTRPSQTTLLINGTPVGSADHLSVNLNTIPLQNIVRIEVIPIGAALAYGISSPGGALNIVTRGFDHTLPFYQFTTLTQENGLEYIGQLHFSQRIYRNINFYMSSLLKKNTLKALDYNAIQYNIKLDFYLKKGWNGSFYSYSHTDDRLLQGIQPATEADAIDDLEIEVAGTSLNEKYNLTQIHLTGIPYHGNPSHLTYYKSTTTRDYNQKTAALTWGDIGFLATQEFNTLFAQHHIATHLDIHHKTYRIQSHNTNALLHNPRADSLTKGIDFTDYTVSLRAHDKTSISESFDINASLAFNMYGYGSDAQLLPTIGMNYHVSTHAKLYALAEKTFANPTPMEQSSARSPYTAYFMGGKETPLLPEKGFSLATGWQYQAHPSFRTNIGLFSKQVTNAIYWNWPERTLLATDTLYLANRSGTETHNGLYADTRFHLFRNRINGGMSFTHLFTTGAKSYGRIPSLPATKIGYFLRAKQMLKKDLVMFLAATINGEYVGEQHKRRWNGDSGSLPAQSFLDVSIFYNFLYIKTYITMRNIFNYVNIKNGDEEPYNNEARQFFGTPLAPMDFRIGISLELGGIYAEEENEEFDHSGIDTDHDGIYDSDDECPELPEDFDNFRDEDGCPDSDNDRDGVPDEKDKCPQTPLSATVDIDGCPVQKTAPQSLIVHRPTTRTAALLPLTGTGVPPEQLAACTSQLHTTLTTHKTYQLTPHQMVQDILGDTPPTNIPESITRTAPLKVPYLITGTIKKTGKTFSLTLHLIDTATGKELLKVTEKYMGPASGLDAAIESIAQKLIKQNR